MWNPFRRNKTPSAPPVDPNRILVAISKPGIYSRTVKGRYSWEDKKYDIMIRLYMSGTKRSWTCTEGGVATQLSSSEMEFWVETGKFAKDETANYFEWLLTPRQQKQQLLKELIAMDPDPPEEKNE